MHKYYILYSNKYSKIIILRKNVFNNKCSLKLNFELIIEIMINLN